MLRFLTNKSINFEQGLREIYYNYFKISFLTATIKIYQFIHE